MVYKRFFDKRLEMGTMKFKSNKPPRIFKVGKASDISISDMGDIFLKPDEQVTFVTDKGNRHDFCRKSWGLVCLQR